MVLGLARRPLARLMAAMSLVVIGVVLCLSGMAEAGSGDYVGSFGPDGSAATEFSKPTALAIDQATGAIYVGDGEAEVLYKFDAEGNPANFEGAAGYISGHEIAGLPFSGLIGQIAVDSDSHVIYVMSDNKVRAFEATGEPHEFTAGPAMGTSELSGAAELEGVAVDKFGNIYTSDLADEKLRIYEPSGELITAVSLLGGDLSPVRPGSLAVAPSGTVYMTDIGHAPEAAYSFEPSNIPVSAATTFGLGQPLDSNPSLTVAVDPVTEYLYVGQHCPLASCQYRVAVFDGFGDLIGTLGAAGPGELDTPPFGVGAYGLGKMSYVAPKEAGGTTLSQVLMFEAFSFFVGPPTILGAGVTDLTSSSAILRGRINANTLETTYEFEYGLTDCATAPPETCTKVPGSAASIGSGHSPVSVFATLSGLTPGTKYYYRLVANNSEGPGEGATATRTFTTKVAQFGSELSDERVWELVTPIANFGGVPTNFGLLQVDPDGSGIAFQTRGSVVAGKP